MLPSMRERPQSRRRETTQQSINEFGRRPLALVRLPASDTITTPSRNQTAPRPASIDIESQNSPDFARNR